MYLSFFASKAHLRHIYLCGSVEREHRYAKCNWSRQDLGAGGAHPAPSPNFARARRRIQVQLRKSAPKKCHTAQPFCSSKSFRTNKTCAKEVSQNIEVPGTRSLSDAPN